jgi:SagB-type dehydrogenase family enzyme
LFCFILTFLKSKNDLVKAQDIIKLPPPKAKLDISFIEALTKRESVRSFKERALTREDVSLILWAAGGLKTSAAGVTNRTTPSAGATYPLEIFLVAGEGMVKGLEKGVYRYVIHEHALEPRLGEDIREKLAPACLGQSFISEAPISIVIAAAYTRTTSKYGQRGIRYVDMEVGHACQNLYLVVQELGLGTVEVGAFIDDKVRQILKLDKNIQPLSIMPIGLPD